MSEEVDMDPTSELPEEQMCYEIKRRKRKRVKRDPLMDGTPNDVKITFDPDSVKVEAVEIVEDYDARQDGANLPKEKTNDTDELDSLPDLSNNLEEDLPRFDGHICDICNSVFSTRQTLIAHKNRKHCYYDDELAYKCKMCYRAFFHKQSLEMHVRRSHTGKLEPKDVSIQVCDICSMNIMGKDRLKIHKMRNHGIQSSDYTHKCPYCTMSYKYYCSLVAHMRRKHVEKDTPNTEEYRCPFCSKLFSFKTSLSTHVKRSHKTNDKVKDELQECVDANGEAKCPQCSLRFSAIRFLRLHLKRVHGMLQETFKFKCTICNSDYNSCNSLNLHIKRQHTLGRFCKVCRIHFANEDAYNQHMAEDTPLDCKQCKVIFDNHDSLAEHVKSMHATGVKHICQECGKACPSIASLSKHMNMKHEERDYLCDKCSKIFKTNESLRKHVRNKHAESFLQRRCIYCKDVFKGKLLLCQHIAEKHKNEELNYTCPICPKKYDEIDELLEHIKTPHVTEPKSVKEGKVVEKKKCELCGLIVNGYHIKQHIAGHVTYNCDYCDFQNLNRTEFTKHMLRHKGVTPMKCDVENCNYSTYNTAVLEKHKLKHAAIKMQCDVCTFKTTNKYLFKYHQKEHGTGTKYKCTQCSYSTSWPGNFQTHKQKHSEERKYKCNICKFSSKYNCSLRFHIKKYHRDL